ncbi:MAG: hypothetical protein HOU81_17465 [Hamadaea sp.]|uniref:hypothetical protein n=1 Tax=Hamadaea sp. TaxID=2024425 RepID=UPI001830D049|nr:hypothetical protein [Hamadaea sp.]NUR72609.1 hypothetical protein [Hamadaea sp.]NUT23096.1 hypothetical protein [Hamadaea sp.]
MTSGVVFPVSDDAGNRSTSALGRAVVAAALREVDPVGARAAEQETGWRSQYIGHFRRQIEAGLTSGAAARRSAYDGLRELHDRMRVITADGDEIRIDEAMERTHTELTTTVQSGEGEREKELTLPYRGHRLAGDELRRQLDKWVEAGVVEPSCADAVRMVLANPDWLALDERRIAVLGAGAEMGPVHSLLRWGADVVAVDLPRPAIWERLAATTRRYAGRLHVPMGPDGDPGADLLHDLPAVARWLAGKEGDLVLGNYVYADGATNVRVSVAVDALTTYLLDERDDLALAFLATPTDAFAVPGEAVAQAERNYQRSSLLKTLRQPVRLLSAGKLLRRNYAPGADPGICDSLVAQQGPNYALAKRLQRWRAAVARSAGTPVSFTVAPPTRTRSVVKNRALAAAYAGAHVFGVEVFEPATANTLMAALLVHDLHNPLPPQEHVWQEEAHSAAHGGLWRTAYAPRSALGLAAMIGIGAAR